MKVCVTSQGPDLASDVDPRFGRARFFVIYDDEADTSEVIDNEQNVNAGGGAGVQSATDIAARNCEWVLSGHVGPKAFSVLQAAGIKVATGVSGAVADVLKQFREGAVQETAAADVRSRW